VASRGFTIPPLWLTKA
jgi:hypothetical protein